MSDPKLIKAIMKAVTIPVMAKVRIGHFVEAQIIEALGVDYIDESEVLTPADPFSHIDKTTFKIPFVCGARDLGEAVRRINEGAAMIRTKGEAGTGNIVEAVRHIKRIAEDLKVLKTLKKSQLKKLAKDYRVPLELLEQIQKLGKLPVVNFAAGGIATPADAALCMQLGVDGVFVGSGIYKSNNPAKRAKAIVEATTHYNDPDWLARVSEDLGEPMPGLEITESLTKLSSRGI
jgi:pyridoxal 5'-phosphate synthase pdxS subunit